MNHLVKDSREIHFSCPIHRFISQVNAIGEGRGGFTTNEQGAGFLLTAIHDFIQSLCAFYFRAQLQFLHCNRLVTLEVNSRLNETKTNPNAVDLLWNKRSIRSIETWLLKYLFPERSCSISIKGFVSSFVTIQSFQRAEIVSVPRSDKKKMWRQKWRQMPCQASFEALNEINGDSLEIKISRL